MYKKRKLEINPPVETRGALLAEVPQMSYVNVRVRKNNETTNTYATSNPKGKNVKDYQLSTKRLTDILFPKWEWSCKYYGLNYAGGHYGDDKYGTVLTSYPLYTADRATQQMKCAIDDYYLHPGGWCDTIAWEAGSQAWFESIFLPATWRTTNTSVLETSDIKCSMSMEGIINKIRGITPSNFYSTENQTSPSTQAAITKDFPIHYNGGYQKHEFINNENFRVYFEAYEVCPRDILTWFYEETKTNGRVFCRTIHDAISSDYIRVREKGGGTRIGAANEIGTYSISLNGSANSNGQIICRKEDPGFAIRGWMSDTLKLFRVSAPIKGSIEPGGKFVYKLQAKPFFMMDSTYRRILRQGQDDANPSGDLHYESPHYNHAIPQFTKFLVVRFWSDVGTLGGTNNAEFESGNPHQYANVSYLPGRLIHVVTEHHEGRAVPSQNFGNRTFKDFTKLQFNQNIADQNLWTSINDETDQSTQLM